jgi:hypothetical protein
MNLMLHDVTAFNGFAMVRRPRSRSQFLHNVLQDAEILGANGNVTALHAPRISLAVPSNPAFPSSGCLDREKGDSEAAYEIHNFISERDALSSFEWEGGLLGPFIRQ